MIEGEDLMNLETMTISEQLMFNTVRLETLNGSSGTGFFYNFNVDGMNYPAIITNKHVVNNNPNETMKFLLHLSENGKVIQENFDVTYDIKWVFHPNPDIDLCFCFVNPLFEQIKSKHNKEVFFMPINEDLIYDQDKLMELSALEPVVMVGYPNGLWDTVNNYPLFRTGVTSSHPAFSFNQEGVGLVDMACFPGSSGSPIFIINENGYSDKKGNMYLGRKRIIFLGILFAGPTMNTDGEIVVEEIPTVQRVFSKSQVMINLGYYVKSYELNTFKEYIKKL